MRSEVLEPSPVRLRAGNAAANTSISYLSLFRSTIAFYSERERESAVAPSELGSDGVEPSSCTYKMPALTLELQAVPNTPLHPLQLNDQLGGQAIVTIKQTSHATRSNDRLTMRPEGFEPSPVGLKVLTAFLMLPKAPEFQGLRFT